MLPAFCSYDRGKLIVVTYVMWQTSTWAAEQLQRILIADVGI